MKSSGNRIAFCSSDAIMDWVCQKVCRLRIPPGYSNSAANNLCAGINNYPVTYSSLEKTGGRNSCPAFFNNDFLVLRQVMLLLVTLFASLCLVSSGPRYVCT